MTAQLGGPTSGLDVQQIEIISFEQQYVNFSSFQPDQIGATPAPNDPKIKTEATKPFDKSDLETKNINLRQIDFWFKQANIFNVDMTMTDTGLAYSKFQVKGISYTDFLSMLEELCNEKEIELEYLKEKLQTCGIPGASKSVKTGPSNA